MERSLSGHKEEDALGNVLLRSFDKRHNVTSERIFELRGSEYFLLSRTSSDYDELGRSIIRSVDRFTAPQGPVPHDQLSAAFSDSAPAATSLSYLTFYDANDRLEMTVDPQSRIFLSTFDAADRILSRTDPLGNVVRYHYDPHDNLVRREVVGIERLDPNDPAAVTGQRFFAMDYSYDELDRRISATDGLGNVTQYVYDSRDNLVARTDPLGNVQRHDFDIFGRCIAEHREMRETGIGDGAIAAVATTRFTHDLNGNLVAIDDPLQRKTRYTYDALDRRRRIIYPDGSHFTFNFDLDSNVVETTDNDGVRRMNAIDALGRITRVDVDATATTREVGGARIEQFEYDGLGRLISCENDFCRCTVRYNSLGWETGQTCTHTLPQAPLSEPFELDRSFDDTGALSELRYPSGRALSFGRDALDRLTTITCTTLGSNYPGDPAATEPAGLVRCNYAGHQRIRCEFANGASVRHRHDSLARTAQIAHQFAAGAELEIQYLYDAAGNIRVRRDAQVDGGQLERFAYDSLYRMIESVLGGEAGPALAVPGPSDTPLQRPIPDRQAQVDAQIGAIALPEHSVTYELDVVGNRKRSRGGSASNYTTNSLDQYTAIEKPADITTVTFGFDSAGNLAMTEPSREFVYDSVNRLVEVRHDGQSVLQVFHDAMGRRILEIDEATRQLTYDGDQQVGEYRDGALFAEFVHDDGTDRPLHIAANRTDHWCHADLVGSVRALSNGAGSESLRIRYDAFGNVESQTSSQAAYTPFLFTGRRLDFAVGLYDFRSREYDPATGRFLQRDSMGMVDETNLYNYVGHNPLGYNDPFGTSKRGEADNNALPEGTLPAEDRPETEFEYPWQLEDGKCVEYPRPKLPNQALNLAIQHHRLNQGEQQAWPARHPSQQYVPVKKYYNHDWYTIDYIPLYERVEVPLTAPHKVLVEDIAPPPGHYTNNPFQTVPFEIGYIYRRIDTTGNIRPYVGQASTRDAMYARWAEHRHTFPNASFTYEVIDRALWAPKPQRRTVASPLDIAEESNIRASGGPWVYGGRTSNNRYQVSLEMYEALRGEIPRPTPNRRIPERWRLRPRPQPHRPMPRAARARR